MRSGQATRQSLHRSASDTPSASTRRANSYNCRHCRASNASTCAVKTYARFWRRSLYSLFDVEHHRGVSADVGSIPFSREGTQMTRIRLRAAEEEARGMQEKLEMSTAEIGLTVRTTNCLEEKGIFTVRDLLNCTRD